MKKFQAVLKEVLELEIARTQELENKLALMKVREFLASPFPEDGSNFLAVMTVAAIAVNDGNIAEMFDDLSRELAADVGAVMSQGRAA